MMTRSRVFLLAVCLVATIGSPVMAAGFDGSEPLLCAVIDVIECQPGGECTRSDAGSVNLPYFINVDVVDKVIRVPKSSQVSRSTPIKMVTHLDGNLILQGTEEGGDDEKDAVGWTLSIDEEDGRMIFSASREKVGFVIFGSCTNH